MGHGSYTAADWQKLKVSRGINQTSSVNSLFQSTMMKEPYNPKFIRTRESCDSNDSPESTPIILAFDTTASMGYLAEEIAKKSLNDTISYIYEKQPVTNPHVMCAAFGNYPDKAPLQVTQFEADIRVVEQLLDLWIEQGGWRYSGDTYVWYFAAKHTKLDAFEKRGKKGFLFTMGDDFCSHNLTASEIKSIFNDTVTSGYTPSELIAMASEKYEVFHIITKPMEKNTVAKWCELLPGRVCVVNETCLSFLSEILVSIMQLTQGKPFMQVIEQWEESHRAVIKASLDDIDLTKPLPKAKHSLFNFFTR